MKKQIITLSIAISTGILMSCNSANKGAENETTTTDSIETIQQDAAPHSDEANNEAKEAHEVDKPGDGPHKGIIEEAGEKNHIEMVVNGKDVSFYPLDDLTNPVDAKGWTGKAIFQYKGGSSKTVDLMMMNDALVAMDANSGKSFTAIATLMNDEQSISAKFSSEGSIGHHEEEGEHHHDEDKKK